MALVKLEHSCSYKNGKQLLLCNSLRFQTFLYKFTLIHDVWTTKGNRFGLIGALVSFINNDLCFSTSFSQAGCLAPQRKL
ncbi:hypothetical protein VP01_5111g1, partial [Puccinia sorghi]